MNFYKNLIKNWSRGRINQRKGKELNCFARGIKVVPYHEFDLEKSNVTVYPAPIFKDKLDFPILIQSIPSRKDFEILGIGYTYDKSVIYWEIDKKKQEKVRRSLVERLNL